MKTYHNMPLTAQIKKAQSDIACARNFAERAQFRRKKAQLIAELRRTA